jgi:hypothetical protein
MIASISAIPRGTHVGGARPSTPTTFLAFGSGFGFGFGTAFCSSFCHWIGLDWIGLDWIGLDWILIHVCLVFYLYKKIK